MAWATGPLLAVDKVALVCGKMRGCAADTHLWSSMPHSLKGSSRTKPDTVQPLAAGASLAPVLEPLGEPVLQPSEALASESLERLAPGV